jgi:hypothetical protein
VNALLTLKAYSENRLFLQRSDEENASLDYRSGRGTNHWNSPVSTIDRSENLVAVYCGTFSDRWNPVGPWHIGLCAFAVLRLSGGKCNATLRLFDFGILAVDVLQPLENGIDALPAMSIAAIPILLLTPYSVWVAEFVATVWVIRAARVVPGGRHG